MAKKKKVVLETDSYLEEMFWVAWNNHSRTKNIRIEQQRKFHPTREWRFDFALPESFTAIEIQGYGSGHASYLGLKRDYEKNNEALRHGWVVIFLMKHDLLPGSVRSTVAYVLSIHEQRLQVPSLYKHIKTNTSALPTRAESFQEIIERMRKPRPS
jgi:hypothetical protein